jgi:hypothetical protein
LSGSFVVRRIVGDGDASESWSEMACESLSDMASRCCAWLCGRLVAQVIPGNRIGLRFEVFGKRSAIRRRDVSSAAPVL